MQLVLCGFDPASGPDPACFRDSQHVTNQQLTRMSCPNVRMAGPILIRVLMIVRNLKENSPVSAAGSGLPSFPPAASADEEEICGSVKRAAKPFDAVHHPDQSEDSQDEDDVQDLLAGEVLC